MAHDGEKLKLPAEHGHAHGHAHTHAPANFDKAFAWGIALNMAFVAVEAVYG